MPLAEVQARMRDAVVAGAADRVMPLLVGGSDPGRRLAVHQRHYQASLVEALLTKFPATVWLMGSDFVAQAARDFVRAYPPAAPCIAEFGAAFPAALATRAEDVPYLQSFATLEWHLGHAAVAIEHAPMAMSDLSGVPADSLPDLCLALQPGLAYLPTQWPVDDLIRLHLEHRAPEQYCFAPQALWLEIRGARGVFSMTRLEAANCAFRQTLQSGASIGDAAEAALDIDAAFDPGQALAVLVDEGLVVAIAQDAAGELT